MDPQTRSRQPSRRESEPQPQHRHVQPKYPDPDPEYRPRRHTDGPRLQKVHSRPEDYKNKPFPDHMVEYICFDKDGHSYGCNCSAEVKPQQQQTEEKTEKASSLDRLDSNSSQSTSGTGGSDADEEDEGCDSEDELTLPPMYHHDIGHRDHEWSSRDGVRTGGWRQSRSPAQANKYHDETGGSYHRANSHSHDQHTDHHRTSVRRHDSSSDSSSSPSPRSRRHSPTGSGHDDSLIAKVAEHLRSHKAAYSHGQENTTEIVNQLLGEVVRKVSDGCLDGDLMREVVREVQHVV